MPSYKDNLIKDLKTLMSNRDVPVEEVWNYYDDTESDGYCDTCYYEWAVVRVEYLDTSGNKETWTYSGSFADLISELDDLN